MDKLRELVCVQVWTGDEWRTVYVSSFIGDAAEVFDNELSWFNGPSRLVSFAVDGVDFIGTHARDFTLVRRTG